MRKKQQIRRIRRECRRILTKMSVTSYASRMDKRGRAVKAAGLRRAPSLRACWGKERILDFFGRSLTGDPLRFRPLPRRRDNSPNGLDHTERPCALRKAVREGQNEPRAAVLQVLDRQDGGEGKKAERRQPLRRVRVETSVRRQRSTCRIGHYPAKKPRYFARRHGLRPSRNCRQYGFWCNPRPK